MRITTRVTVFFLGALAAVLIGISLGTYYLVRSQYYQAVYDQLNAGANTLIAAAEARGRHLYWEPHARPIVIGVDPAKDQTRWIVTNKSQLIIDSSENIRGEDVDRLKEKFRELAGEATQKRELMSIICYDQQEYMILRLLLIAVDPDQTPQEQYAYRQLNFVVGVSTESTKDLLSQLRLGLILISICVWFSIALMGRWLTSRMLAPLSEIAEAAGRIRASDLRERIPSYVSKDEIQELSRSFNDLLDRASLALERQKRFASKASHQLRTPLTMLMGEVDVTLRRERQSEEYKKTLIQVRSHAAQLQQIVEMLLFLARMDVNQPLPGATEFDFEKFIKDMNDKWQSQQRFTNTRFHFTNTPHPVFGSQLLMGQLLENLLDNATKYGQKEDPIEVTWNARDGELYFSVRNSGGNLNTEELSHIFEPFFRAGHATREASAGTGLGLTIVKRIAEVHGGSVKASCTPNVETTFSVRLPLAANSGTPKA